MNENNTEDHKAKILHEITESIAEILETIPPDIGQPEAIVSAIDKGLVPNLTINY